MEFVLADAFKSKFSVYGHFYKLKIGSESVSCRSVLEIIQTNESGEIPETPCAVIVMMNPGSSSPKDQNYIEKEFVPSEIRSSSWFKEVIPAKPDPAQYQIMRLMLLEGWNHVRILNLSDLCNGNSGSFSTDFSHYETLDSSNPHCITDIGRRTELNRYCSKVQYIVAAWGREKVLLKSAEDFLENFNTVSGISVGYPCYYYASPSRKDYKLKWLENIQPTLINRNISIY